MDRYVAPLRAGRVVVFSRRREPTTSGIYMLLLKEWWSRGGTSLLHRVKVYVLLRNKRYNKERYDSKTLLRPVLKFYLNMKP